MIKSIRYGLMVCLFSMHLVTLWGQDLHFSQFMNSPLLTNPANAGFIPDGDYRLGANYRNQWASVTAFPYKTMSLFGDMQVMPDPEANGWIGLGGLVLRDVAGTGVLTSTKAYGAIAYHQMLGVGSLLSVGFNVGWSNKQINTQGLSFPSQWNGQFFDIHQTGAPSLLTNQSNYLDLQTGLNYAYFPNDKVWLNGGVSVMHVNRPRESFFASSDSAGNRLSMRYNGFFNSSFKLNDRLIISPAAYYTLQARSSQLMGSVQARYNASGDGTTELLAGLAYRHRESVIPMLGVGMNDLMFTFSYDVTLSGLNAFNGARGAFEFSLVKQGRRDKYRGNGRESMCPSFRY
ncbi:MAG: PorP/SprF family type IX secretion system membrane protein [Bacteroidota bacterium]